MGSMTRREMLSACAAACLAPTAVGARQLGVVIHSYGNRVGADQAAARIPPLSDPLTFLEHCRALRASGVQIGLGIRDASYLARLRDKLDACGMYIEGIVRAPQKRSDVERFDAEVQTARQARASVLRTVLSTGRRYEIHESASSFQQATDRAYEMLGLAAPILSRHDAYLAVENHKDWRADELLAMLKRLSNRHVGICVDFGNSIALLEDPAEVVQAYAPWALTTHVKDMAVHEYEQGFLLSEVPLGEGILDLGAMMDTLRRARPDIHFNLEMITRDPLKVPCLTPKYWASSASLPARCLAKSLSMVRRLQNSKPQPRTTGLTVEQRVKAEEENVQASLAYARNRLLR